ncbi:hypothetical protein THAOC_20891, partial [Thalassiosira oceanica]
RKRKKTPKKTKLSPAEKKDRRRLRDRARQAKKREDPDVQTNQASGGREKEEDDDDFIVDDDDDEEDEEEEGDDEDDDGVHDEEALARPRDLRKSTRSTRSKR